MFSAHQDAADLPDFGKFTYRKFTPVDLNTILPNLPQDAYNTKGLVDIISGFLKYSFVARLGAGEVISRPWLKGDVDMPQDAKPWFH